MNKTIGKSISKNVSGKYRQKVVDHAKQSAMDAFKTSSKRAIQKTAEATGDLVDNKIAAKITKVSKNSQQNNSETVTNENDKEIVIENIYICRGKTVNKLFVSLFENDTNRTEHTKYYLQTVEIKDYNVMIDR